MGTIHTNSLQPGMVLAAEVRDRTGRVLLGAGQELTDRHIRLFKMWGIIEADVDGVAQDDIEAEQAKSLDPELVREAREQTQALFAFANQEHPAMRELARLIAQRRLQAMKEARHGEQSA